MDCRFCGGTGTRYQPWALRPCLACDGTGQELPRWNPEREEARHPETTRAVLKDGPAREHGGLEEAEEKSTPNQGTRNDSYRPRNPHLHRRSIR